jgi:hypothetical protein
MHHVLPFTFSRKMAAVSMRAKQLLVFTFFLIITSFVLQMSLGVCPVP